MIKENDQMPQALNSIKELVRLRNADKVMFTPGPTNMSWQNMYDLKGVFGRGDEEYTHIEDTVLNNILELTGHDEIVRLQGGGTTAIDVVTSNIVLGKILVIDAGYYSKRIATIIDRKSKHLSSTSVKVIAYNDLDKELGSNSHYDWIATAYAETADAFLCDIHKLRSFADAKGARLFLDSTASINLERHHDLADVCSFSSCKGLGGLTGAAFITYRSEAYHGDKVTNVSYSLDLQTHKNKLYTGPYHAICSLYGISKDFGSITRNVRRSKAIFLETYKERIVREELLQPAISTLINVNNLSAHDGAILYQPRTAPPNTAVICHFGDMFTPENSLGEIYKHLIME